PKVVLDQAKAITEGVKDNHLLNIDAPEESGFSKDDYEGIFKNWQPTIDMDKGGFEGSQKFPLPVGWEFLLQYHYLTGNEDVLKAVEKTLTEMACGGIFDQLGGGFSRYSVDENWFAPHFEKMLYDNAQLVSLYAHAFQVTQNPLYRATSEKTLEFVERELTARNGGFYSALNADSEGQEGKFYVWTAAEIEKILNHKEAEMFRDRK